MYDCMVQLSFDVGEEGWHLFKAAQPGIICILFKWLQAPLLKK